MTKLILKEPPMKAFTLKRAFLINCQWQFASVKGELAKQANGIFKSNPQTLPELKHVKMLHHVVFDAQESSVLSKI